VSVPIKFRTCKGDNNYSLTSLHDGDYYFERVSYSGDMKTPWDWSRNSRV